MGGCLATTLYVFLAPCQKAEMFAAVIYSLDLDLVLVVHAGPVSLKWKKPNPGLLQNFKGEIY